jgi:hypothetical protein
MSTNFSAAWNVAKHYRKKHRDAVEGLKIIPKDAQFDNSLTDDQIRALGKFLFVKHETTQMFESLADEDKVVLAAVFKEMNRQGI